MKYLFSIVLFSMILISQPCIALPKISPAQIKTLGDKLSSVAEFVSNAKELMKIVKEFFGGNSETLPLSPLEEKIDELAKLQRKMEQEIKEITLASQKIDDIEKSQQKMGREIEEIKLALQKMALIDEEHYRIIIKATDEATTKMLEIQNLQNNLYTAYLSSNESSAFGLFEQLAPKDAGAKFFLGLMYMDGKGPTAKNLRQACILFKEASQQGYVPATDHLNWDCSPH